MKKSHIDVEPNAAYFYSYIYRRDQGVKMSQAGSHLADLLSVQENFQVRLVFDSFLNCINGFLDSYSQSVTSISALYKMDSDDVIIYYSSFNLNALDLLGEF